MKILFVGGTHFMGAEAVKALAPYGHEIACVHRSAKTSPGFPAEVRHIACDRRDRVAFAAILAENSPEVVVDMVGFDDDADELLNVLPDSTRRIVFASSADAYIDLPGGTSLAIPIKESDAVRAEPWPKMDNPACERALLAAAEGGRVEAAILRLPGAYGPNDYNIREWFFVKRILDGRRKVALADGGLQLFHRGHSEDIGRAIAKAAVIEKLPQRIYNIGHLRAWTVARLAEEFAKAAGHEWEPVSVPASALPYSNPYQITTPIVLDVSAAVRDLGLSDAKTVAERTKEIFEYYRDNPPSEAQREWFAKMYRNPFDYEAEDAAIEKA